jgi:fumarylacetoacetate (FAA) hydrolase
MKVATYRNGTRDGALTIVSRDLRKMVPAASVIAGLETLQQLLDDWDDLSLKVERVYAELHNRRFSDRSLHGTAAARLPVGGRFGLR